MKKKNILLTIIPLVILLIAICVAGIVYIMKNSNSKYDEVTTAALSYFESADYDNAIIKYEEALKLDDKSADAYEGLARTYAAKSDYVTAMGWLEMGIKKTHSQKLKKMLADYQTILNESGITFEYSLNDVLNNSSDITLYHDMIAVIDSYDYGDYSAQYTFSDNSTDTCKIVNEIPIVLNFAEPPVADSQPISVYTDDIRYLFTNFSSGVSFARLQEIGAAGLSHGFNSIINCEAVEFDYLECHIAVECDSEGNITKNKPKNVITFGDRTDSEIVTEPVYNEVEEVTEADESENMRTFKGYVYDADTQKSAGVVQMSIFKGKQSAKGELYAKIETNSSGDFKIDLPYGIYSIEFTAKDYIKTTEEVTIKQTDDITAIDFYLSKFNSANAFRIVLTWNDVPRDVDSHLIGKSSNGSNVKLWFGDKTVKDSSGNTIATLDIDDTYGYGKETTMIYDTNGSYTFYVKNFSQEAPLSASGATVTIYEGDSENPIHTITLPENFSGNIWEVFKIENGTITITNKESAGF